jgi:hypothetical protein
MRKKSDRILDKCRCRSLPYLFHHHHHICLGDATILHLCIVHVLLATLPMNTTSTAAKLVYD